MSGSMAIGMKRLAIIDVAGGDQPIWNEDKTVAVVCNGEIYNYQELTAELKGRGHVFHTRSDVEVIVHLYEELGEKSFTRLNGMFAAAIADYRRSELVLARDPFGQKPLYVWQESGILRFVSELKCFAWHPEFNRKISQKALAQLLAFRYIPSPLTIFEKATKLPPGTSLRISASGQSTARYWQIDLGPRSQKDVHHGGSIGKQLMASVARHLMSERPLGVFLSGGVDSSAIVACMHGLGQRRIHTYTVGFEGFPENEFSNAARVAKHFGTDHTEVTLTASEFWDGLDTVLYAMDEPIADLTAYPVYRLSQRARQDVVVVLSGEGADELLAGYEGSAYLRRFFDRLHTLRGLSPIARLGLRFPLPGVIKRRLRTLAGTDADYLARNPSSMGITFGDEYRRFYCPQLNNGTYVLADLSEYFARRQDWHGLNLHLGGLIENWLPDELLHKADRITMAHSLELRCPFLDMEFAAYCASLSLDAKVGCTDGEAFRKVALKKAFQNLLPEGIAYQPKKGFTIPVYCWLESLFAKNLTHELQRKNGLGVSLFSSQALQEISEKARSGDLLNQRRAWIVICLNKWGDRWL